MSKHTPGPFYSRATGSGQFMVASEKTGQTVAVVYTNEHDGVVLAAAPCLLSACLYALGFLENLTTEDFSKGRDKPMRDKLRAAIAKAEKGGD